MSDKRNLLAGINLNLFPVLEALLRHRSATRAAVELGVTQSAVSHSLRELRAVLDDPLFVRSRSGLVPTERAKALEMELRTALGSLGNVVQKRPSFKPALCDRHCTIATSDDLSLTLLPAFTARVLSQAPEMTLDIRPRKPQRMDDLESGQTDLLLQLAAQTPAWADSARVYSDGMACLVCRDHPEVDTTLSLDVYRRSPHVRISPDGYGTSAVDRHLKSMGIERRVAVYSHSFVTAPEFIAGTAAILTIPARMAHVLAPRLGLKVLAPPVALPGFDVDVVWHRGRADDAVLWLGQELVAVGQAQMNAKAGQAL